MTITLDLMFLVLSKIKQICMQSIHLQMRIYVNEKHHKLKVTSQNILIIVVYLFA